jgi:glycosyltransferase involved in cell wall biosynthesis
VKKLEIVFCTDGIFPHAIGGMQRHSRLLVEELAKDHGLSIIVVHPHAAKKVFDESTGVEEIEIDIGRSSGKYLVDCYTYSKEVFKIIRQHPQALIYAQGLSVWYNITHTGKRVIINPHGLEPFQAISLKDKIITAPFRLIFRYLFKRSAMVVSLGGRLTGILQQLAGANGKVVVLPNAVNIPAEMNRSFTNLPVKFLFVGRFAFNKGIGILLDAIMELNKEGYENKMFFNLVGKGPLYDEFKSIYQAPNIHFAGFADDNELSALYRSSDVFVLPTLFEGMPTVVLEAMCYSMPVIVTDVGATRELVDESNGFIIEKNSVDSLKKAMLKYFNMTAVERKSLADRSYLKVKDNFTWPVVAEKHKTIFRQLYASLTKGPSSS